MSYKQECKILLENSFPRVSCAVINAVLHHVEFEFPEAFALITMRIQPCFPNDLLAKASCRPFILSDKIRVFLKHDRPQKRLNIRNATLRAQINDNAELNQKENKSAQAPVIIDFLDIEDDDDRKPPARNLEAEEEVDCGCCYTEFPRRELRACSGNPDHLVCQECIYRFVSEQLDGNGSVNFQCIVHPDCASVYTHSLLDQVLSPKLKQRTNDAIFREEVKAAGLSVWTCPKCAYIGIPDERFSTIECAVCQVFYCVACHELAHKNQTCEEVRKAKERQQDPTHRAHEAMSEAVTRRCPACRNEFVKRDGCNKMKCTCKALSCYLCGIQVQGYDHFCNHDDVHPTKEKPCRHCGKTCELFTNTYMLEWLDRRARRKAGKAVLKEMGITDQKEIERILQSPDKKSQKKKAPPTAAAAAVAAPPPPQQVPQPRHPRVELADAAVPRRRYVNDVQYPRLNNGVQNPQRQDQANHAAAAANPNQDGNDDNAGQQGCIIL